MQLVEAFVWTFGDSNSILLSSLLLLLLFADMPFISSATPFYLMRIDRKTWLTGQAAYIALATLIYLAFILISTSLVCMRLHRKHVERNRSHPRLFRRGAKGRPASAGENA